MVKEPPIHPLLSITERELRENISSLPEDIQMSILERPQVFADLVIRFLKEDPALSLLVDKNNPLPADYNPQDRRRVDFIKDLEARPGVTLREILFADLAAMNMAMKIKGMRLAVSSAYRSYDYQGEVYNRHLQELGQEEASRVSAYPGTSQHQLGLAIDFGSITPEFADTQEGLWLAENAWQYGFSLSYPEGQEDLTGYKYEPWHYRYLGRTGALLEKEFFMKNQQAFLLFLKEKGDLFMLQN